MTPNPNPSPELREAITAAIGKADDAFGYSYRMTSLVDDVATHTLYMDGFEPTSFDDRDDGVRLIAERRNRLRADAVLAALSPQTLPAPGEDEHGDIATIAYMMGAKDERDRQAAPATVAAANDEGVALDWRAVAKLAGEHGVRYRTNTALEKFLAAIRLLSQGGGKA